MKRAALCGCIAAALAAALPQSAALAQDCPTTFGPSVPVVREQFGVGAAIDAGIAVVGTLPGNGTQPGSAYVIDLVSGTQRLKLTGPVPSSETLFGATVAIAGNFALVGAEGSVLAGTVYVFDATTGDLLHTLQASDAQDNDGFGSAVAASGNLAVVGAKRHATSADDTTSGSAYVFDLTTGAELLRLTPVSPRPIGDRFGHSVAIRDGWIAVGAPNDDSRALLSFDGAVYLFEAQTGKLRRKVVASDTASRWEFGNSVAVEGTRLFVGAPGADSAADAAGAVYLFDIATGAETHRITLAEGQAQDRFGSQVAMFGGRAVASAALIERRGGAGSAYVFDALSGDRISTLPPGGRDPGDNFGAGIALDAERLIVGAPGDNDRGDRAGELQMFRIDDLPDTPIVFDPLPTVTRIKFEITIPGFGTFVFERELIGRVIAQAPLDCKPPKSFRIVSAEFRSTVSPDVYTAGPAVTFTFHEPGISIAGDGSSAVVAPDGTFEQVLEFAALGTLEFDYLGSKTTVDLTKLGTLAFTLRGSVSEPGGVLRLDGEVPETTALLGLGFGLGAGNPTYRISGTFAALRSPRRFVPRTPSVAKKAALAIDFVNENKDSVTFSGTFERTRPPGLTGGATGTLRIGAFRADVTLSEKGATAKGAPAAVKLKLKKKAASFKIQVKLADLRAALAALPSVGSLPRAVRWSLELEDEWNIGGELSLNGGDKLKFASEGVLATASLKLTKP